MKQITQIVLGGQSPTLTPNDDYQFPKRFSEKNHKKSSCNSYTHVNRFHALSVNEDTQNSNEDLTSQSHRLKHSDDNQNQKYTTGKTTRNRPVILGDFRGLNSEIDESKRVGVIKRKQ